MYPYYLPRQRLFRVRVRAPSLWERHRVSLQDGDLVIPSWDEFVHPLFDVILTRDGSFALTADGWIQVDDDDPRVRQAIDFMIMCQMRKSSTTAELAAADRMQAKLSTPAYL